jgi:WD40 repeat protein
MHKLAHKNIWTVSILSIVLLLFVTFQSGQAMLLAQAQAEFGEITSLAWSPDGNVIVSSHYSDVIAFWNSTTGQLTSTFVVSIPEVPNITHIMALSWSPTGTAFSLVASNDSSYALIVIDPTNQDILAVFPNEGGGYWSNNPNQIMSVFSDGIYPFNESVIRVREVSSGQIISELPIINLSIVAWSLEGSKVATVSNNNVIQMWDVATQSLISELTAHTDIVRSMSWSPVDSNRLATGSQDFTTKIWDITNGQVLVNIALERFGIRVVWSRDGQRLAVQTTPYARIYSPITGQALTDQFVAVLPIDLSPDGSRIITSDPTGTFTLTDAFPGSATATPTDTSTDVPTITSTSTFTPTETPTSGQITLVLESFLLGCIQLGIEPS